MSVLLLALLQAPLHERIDQLIAERSGGRPADDAEFLRRATLDLAGEIPTAAAARAFLDDGSPDKRAVLIDRLVSGPRFTPHLADRLDLMLMERLGSSEEWRRWLLAAIAADTPWDRMAREILAPDFEDEGKRGAGAFITKRLEKYGQNPTDYPGLTRDVGRLFLGVDLQCAQCHRHLSVKDYKQVDFQGLFIAYQNLTLQGPTDAIKVPWVTEGLLTAELEFVSVFKKEKETTPPRVPFGEPISVPQHPAGEEWARPPDKAKRVPGVPKFSPTREIAARLATPENPAFVRAIVNRAWFMMMGRGLVEPLDLFHSANPPSHPELLDLLAAEFVADGMSLRRLLRELALTRTYQRSSLVPEGTPSEPLFLVAMEKPIASEAFLRSVLIAAGELARHEADPKLMDELNKAFLAAFANAPREPELTVNPTLKGALFLRNGGALRALLERRDGNLTDRLSKLEDPAEELYLSVLTRRPSPEEREEVARWLRGGHGVGSLAWALLASAEFFANH